MRLLIGHNSDGKFIARAQRIEFDCELIARRVAIFIEKSKDGQVVPVPNVVVRDVACGGNHTVSPLMNTASSDTLPAPSRTFVCFSLLFARRALRLNVCLFVCSS